MSRQLRHRTRSEVIPSILEVTNGNKVRITEIELKASLPYNILKEYLVQVISRDRWWNIARTSVPRSVGLAHHSNIEDCMLA